jgi:hypothetical protein
MKTLLNLYLALYIFIPQQITAQCNYESLQPLVLGHVVVDSALCPSSGRIGVNNVTGGGGNYVYEIIAGPVTRMIQSQNTFNALPAGNYTVRVTSCNGKLKDTGVTIANGYTQFRFSDWFEQSMRRVSGLTCGATNNGVYKITKPNQPGGTAPYRFQIATSSNFTGIPFLPGFDSAVFTNLSENTNYEVRITDACNNFMTMPFTTPATTPVVPLSVPTLSFHAAYYLGSCSGNMTMYMHLKDSASGLPYTPSNAYSNKVFWGNFQNPYIRVRIQGASNNIVYADRNVNIVPSSGNNFFINSNVSHNGETGLQAPGVGAYMFSYYQNTPNILPPFYVSSEFPAGQPLNVTIYFPGGNHCGTIIQPYTKTFTYTPGSRTVAPPRIVAITPRCETNQGNYLRVDINRTYFYGTVTLVKPNPTYQVLHSVLRSTGTWGYIDVYHNYTVGETYRIIIEDTCGVKDSMNVTYNPGGAPIPPPIITDSVGMAMRCPFNANDSIYQIFIKPLPAGYVFAGVTIDGIGSANYYEYTNWNNTGRSAYRINTNLPPGTYTYRIVWVNQCSDGEIVKPIIITAATSAPQYTAALNLSIETQSSSCYQSGYTAIRIGGSLRNISTNYSIANLRLVSGPHNYVYPVEQFYGNPINNVGGPIDFFADEVPDGYIIDDTYYGFYVKQGNEGRYTIAFDVICPNGTIVSTVTQSIDVTSITTYQPSYPSLANAYATICDNNAGALLINMKPVGGIAPFYYEYKLEQDENFIPTGNSGADSAILINPVPAPGTIYDIRVSDNCGNSDLGKVSVASFTGQFYIYQYPPNCATNPFDTRVGTSSINGAYYTWRRNGVIIAQGFNITQVDLTGVTQDSISVNVNLAGCLNQTASRVVVFTNPCDIRVLTPNALRLYAQRNQTGGAALYWQHDFADTKHSYQIEKSSDGKNFTGISTLQATLPSKVYTYLDSLAATHTYYRIKQTLKSGAISYSNVVELRNDLYNKGALQVSPNPATSIIVLKLTSVIGIAQKITIYDISGRAVLQIPVTNTQLKNGKLIDVSAIKAGNYVIAVTNNTGNVTHRKFVKL